MVLTQRIKRYSAVAADVPDPGALTHHTPGARSVLRGYPEGAPVLRELLQNADDAHATEFALCLDLRAHGTHDLLFPQAAGLQGPAVLAYNDAVFTDADYASIRRLGDSGKKQQTGKVGRFGVGFNGAWRTPAAQQPRATAHPRARTAVYHLTDLPSFVSGDYLSLLDPHMRFLALQAGSDPGIVASPRPTHCATRQPRP